MEFREEFESIETLLKTLDNRKQNKSMENCYSSKKNSEDFTGTESYEEAIRLFREGDKEKYNLIQQDLRTSAKIKTSLLPKRQVKTGVVGYAPNVPNALMGLPNSMIYTEKVKMKSKVVSILYSNTEHCGTSVEKFVKSGVALLNTINALELSGYRVEVKLVFFNAICCDEKLRAFVKIKNYNEHLDLLKMAFPLANPSMFRRFGFRWLETVPCEISGSWYWAYGSPNSDEDLSKDNIIYLTMGKIENCHYDAEKIIKNNFKKLVN